MSCAHTFLDAPQLRRPGEAAAAKKRQNKKKKKTEKKKNKKQKKGVRKKERSLDAAHFSTGTSYPPSCAELSSDPLSFQSCIPVLAQSPISCGKHSPEQSRRAHLGQLLPAGGMAKHGQDHIIRVFSRPRQHHFTFFPGPSPHGQHQRRIFSPHWGHTRQR